ncbi:hypothetical protein CPHO_00650 [Corynebacterium phocae]|uniref:Uncharacterized protein n=1 Tax=Corynebacterium phocae TaxID=161895 RepID=A0A1L7D0R6_9CORY|nr:hypothetical protein [Corynebacterium phocae]APT91680.1 hypothetical protein CPHO_00650 [Corynebacterium phocae]KAA8728589.1 hypothetical protein F4V58_00205 [Corynebacterium phocae]
MKKFRLVATSVVAACALTTGVVSVPSIQVIPAAQAAPAPGEVQLRNQRVFAEISSDGTRSHIKFDDRLSDGSPLIMDQRVHAFVIDGDQRQVVTFAADDAFERTAEGSKTFYTRTHTDSALEVQLTYMLSFDTEAKTVEVSARLVDNSAEGGRTGRVEISNVPEPAFSGLSYGVVQRGGGFKLAYQEEDTPNSVVIKPGAGYKYSLSGPAAETAANDDAEGMQVLGDSAERQFTVWESAEGADVAASVALEFASTPGVIDSDEDGMPDALERYLAPRYGTNPDEKQIYLQLNWMSSQRAVARCADLKEQENSSGRNLTLTPGQRRTNNEAKWYLECVTKDNEHYAPRVEDLEGLVELFADNGYSLLIDAGNLYHNFTGTAEADLRGGPVDEYRRDWFENVENGTVGELLRLYSQNISKERQNIFRAGFLGGRRSTTSNSTGVSLLGHNSFYVAIPAENPEEVRFNTILHEFGHSLSLTHGGVWKINGEENPDHERNFVADHKSVMNYLYQLDSNVRNLLDHDVISDPSSPGAEEARQTCLRSFGSEADEHCPQPGESYKFYDEWDNLILANSNIGKKIEEIAPLTEEELHFHEERPSIDDLLDQRADANDGVGTIETLEPYDLLQFYDGNNITVEVNNVGSTEETFTLFYSYLDRVEQEVFTLAPRGQDGAVEKRKIPMPGLKDYELPNIEVGFRLVNSASETQSSKSQTFSFLPMPADKAKTEFEKIANDPDTSDEDKEQAQRLIEIADKSLKPDASTSNTTPPKISKPDNTPAPKPEPKPAPANGSSDDSWIIAVVLAVLGLLGAAGAAVFANGQLPAMLRNL